MITFAVAGVLLTMRPEAPSPLHLKCHFVDPTTLSCVLRNRSREPVTVSTYLLGDRSSLELRAPRATTGSRLSPFSPLSAGASASHLRTLKAGESTPPFTVVMDPPPTEPFILVQHLGNDGAPGGWAGAAASSKLVPPRR